MLDKLIKGPGLVINIPEIIQNVELRSQHKTAAYAFRHNERSQNYYTARGKVRKPSDLSDQTKPESLRRDSLPQEEPETHDTVPVQHNLKLEQVSPKIDTPPDTGFNLVSIQQFLEFFGEVLNTVYLKIFSSVPGT